MQDEMLLKVANANAVQVPGAVGGMFSVAGAGRELISTFITPSGISAFLPSFPTVEANPLKGFWTGVGSETGSESDYPCDDGPTSMMYGGYLTYAFGRVNRSTPTIEPTAVLERSRGVMDDITVLGNAFSTHPLLTSGNRTPTQVDLAVASAMGIVGVNLQSKTETLNWQGTPANNSANGGYAEYLGLDTQIGTGKVDSLTSTAMAGADSSVYDFAYNYYDSASPDLVRVLSSMMYSLEYTAERTGLNPVRHVICMTPAMWYNVATMWACRYMTDSCGTAGGDNVVVVNDDRAVRMRDDMFNNKYITINGKSYTVVTDDGKKVLTGGSVPVGKYASDIAVVPLTILGRIPVTYYEYLNYGRLTNEYQALASQMGRMPFWTDGGTTLWGMKTANFCITLTARISPRLVLRTPQLAGKIQNVVYDDPEVPLRGAYPAGANWKAGGVATR